VQEALELYMADDNTQWLYSTRKAMAMVNIAFNVLESNKSLAIGYA